ncbi:hypothetical protein BDQ17DRAFT_1508548 [Cyathus striatus]|nr:hypothetical protein BDQ17DRAFT_1508548 [Cyathus striatus]
MNEWTSPIYAFFHPVPNIGCENGQPYHEFKCFAKSCMKKPIRRYLDTKDTGSTGNMHKHAQSCWGDDNVKLAMEMKNTDDARGALSLLNSAKIVRWVAKSSHPFSIVNNCRFKVLMKTGQPEYYLPSPNTVSHDVREVFARTRHLIAKLL